MAKRKQSSRKPTNPLDRASEGRPRGRPGVRASEIEGRAYHYRLIFEEIWDVVGESLLKAQTEENVIQVLQRDGRYTNEFAPIASLVLEVLRDPDFPKRKREAQIGFLADSLAGRGWITPRTSRDICERGRAREKHAQHIIRCEVYVECSCGYKGPALDNACRKCKAEIPFWLMPGGNPFAF